MPQNRQAADRDTARLFLALCPGTDVQAALAMHSDAWQWNTDAARYAPPDWHITLHFMGSVARQRLDELRSGLAVPMTPFELRFGQPELWRHGLAVLLPKAVPEGLQRLYGSLEQALQRLGLKTEARPYRPHFTLARHAALAQLPLTPPSFGWQVEGYALMESTGDARQRYRVLQHYAAVS